MKTLAAIRDEDLSTIGEKAATLSRLVRAGFPVPEAAVLDTTDLARFTRGVPPPDLAALLSRCIGALRARGYAKLVIRTSGAGAGEAISRIPTDDFGAVLAAIRKCVEATGTKNALIIQAMIPGEVAGTLFTLDPTRGLDTTQVIEAGRGSRKERTSYDWRTDSLTTGGSLLSPERVRALSTLALGIQREFGAPLEIEWTMQAGKFFILQAKPIARLEFETEDEWTCACLRDGTAPSGLNPLMTGLYRTALDRVLPEVFAQMRMPPPEAKWTRAVGGQLYWNLGAAKLAVKPVPGYVEREFDTAFGILPVYEGTGETTPGNPMNLIRRMRTHSAIKNAIRERATTSSLIADRFEKLQSELGAVRLKAMTDSELAARAEKLLDLDWPFLEGGSFAHRFTSALSRSLLPKAAELHQALAKPSEALRALSPRVLNLVQSLFLEIGRRCVAKGTLKAPDAILFLEARDGLALFAGKDVAKLGALLEKNRTYAESYRNFRMPSEIRPARGKVAAAPSEKPAKVTITPSPTPVGTNRIRPRTEPTISPRS